MNSNGEVDYVDTAHGQRGMQNGYGGDMTRQLDQLAAGQGLAGVECLPDREACLTRSGMMDLLHRYPFVYSKGE